jgi:hypothetical protein
MKIKKLLATNTNDFTKVEITLVDKSGESVCIYHIPDGIKSKIQCLHQNGELYQSYTLEGEEKTLFCFVVDTFGFYEVYSWNFENDYLRITVEI